MVEKLYMSDTGKYFRYDQLEFRMTSDTDASFLKKWISKSKEWFPVDSEDEIDVVVRNWIDYRKVRSAITVTVHGEPIGMSVLYLCPFKKLKHQCEIAMIISDEYRRMGIGSLLLDHMIKYAVAQFEIKKIHLHIYKGNPAIAIYKKFKFETYGIQQDWVWDGDDLKDRILMSKEVNNYG